MINQPQENPNISDDIKKQDAIVRDKITVNEAEVKRLKGIITSSKYTIGELNKESHEKRELILKLDEKKCFIDAEIEKSEKSATNTALVLTDLQDKELVLKEKQDLREKAIEEKESELTQREEKVIKDEKAVKDTKKEAEEILKDAVKKKEILTEALSKV